MTYKSQEQREQDVSASFYPFIILYLLALVKEIS